MLTLRADGRVDVITMGGPQLTARLDSRGCLVGPDGLWAELTPNALLWTPHELLATDGATIRLPDGVALRITPDGRVARVERDGHTEPNAHGTIYLQGYREGAACAGLLLLGAFLTMMPSMAVVDGHPAMAPAPEGSLCNEFRHPEPPMPPPTTPVLPAEEPFPESGNGPPPPAGDAGATDPPRILGCSTGGAMAEGSHPNASGKPPTMKGATTLRCQFPSGPGAAGIDGACVPLAVGVGIVHTARARSDLEGHHRPVREPNCARRAALASAWSRAGSRPPALPSPGTCATARRGSSDRAGRAAGSGTVAR